MRDFIRDAPRPTYGPVHGRRKTWRSNMRKLGVLIAIACLWLFAVATPSVAGCICKDTRATWCAKNCYVCFANRAVPAGYCSYWLRKRKQQVG
jgi:hypothetical protein